MPVTVMHRHYVVVVDRFVDRHSVDFVVPVVAVVVAVVAVAAVAAVVIVVHDDSLCEPVGDSVALTDTYRKPTVRHQGHHVRPLLVNPCTIHTVHRYLGIYSTLFVMVL